MATKKMISNPLSDYERKGLKICSKVLAQKTLLEANERKLCYQAGVVNKWFINTIPRFTSLFIQLLNLKNEKKIDIKLNIKKIITQTQKSFEQNLTSLKQIISMADCYFNQDEDNYYIEAYKLYKKAEKKNSPRALFQIGFYHYSGYPKNFMEMSYKNEDDLVDYEKAFFYFNEAYQRKEKESLYYLGDLFHYGRGVEQDSEKAIFYFEEYFNEGNYFVLQYIVKLIFYDLVDNCVFLERDSITVRIKDKKDLENAKKCKDYLVKSIEYLEEIIDQLYSKSEFNYYLALMYAIGSHFLPNGHTKNSQIAKEYFSKACKEEEEYEGCKESFLDLLNIESVLFKDEIKISEKSYDLKDLYQKPKVSLVVDNVTKLISEGQSKSINDVMYNHIWIDNHIRGGESPNLEFKPRVFFLQDEVNKNQIDAIKNSTVLEIARLICGFANATTDGLEKNYIFFGVSDLNEFIGIEDDLNFLKNDQNEAKIVDRIIQFIREKLDVLLGKSEVAKYIKIFERFHIRYKKRIILLEIKKSEEPLFIKFDHKIFAKASKIKLQKQSRNFDDKSFCTGLWVRSQRDTNYFQGFDQHKYIKIRFTDEK